MGAANSGPIIPKVVINEIRYKAVNKNDALHEYIELFNRSSETIYLYDINNPTNTWKFANGIEFTFPEGSSIASGDHILITRTDPDIFRYLNNIPLSTPIYGPYINALDNDKDSVEILIPGSPEPSFVPYITSEKISYSDGSGGIIDLWPSEADLLEDYSLQRIAYDGYANTASNWQALSISPSSENGYAFQMLKDASGIHMHWLGDGVLQKSFNLSDPWIDVNDWSSPHTIDTSESPNLFIRFNY